MHSNEFRGNSEVVYNEMRAGINGINDNVPDAGITSLFEENKKLKK
jgi:hypothetical protein